MGGKSKEKDTRPLTFFIQFLTKYIASDGSYRIRATTIARSYVLSLFSLLSHSLPFRRSVAFHPDKCRESAWTFGDHLCWVYPSAAWKTPIKQKSYHKCQSYLDAPLQHARTHRPDAHLENPCLSNQALMQVLHLLIFEAVLTGEVLCTLKKQYTPSNRQRVS